MHVGRIFQNKDDSVIFACMPCNNREDKARWSSPSLTHFALRWFPAGHTHVTTIVTDTCIRETVVAVCVCTRQKQGHAILSLCTSLAQKEWRVSQSSLAWVCSRIPVHVVYLVACHWPVTSHRERWWACPAPGPLNAEVTPILSLFTG